MRTGLEVGATSPRPAGAGRDLGPADARREGREPAPVPRPRPGLRDTPRLAAGHLRARHVLPPRPAPRVPPGLGAVTGGRGGTRRARRLEAWAGKRGAAGRSERPGVWASVAPVSRSSEGRPGRGWGGGRNRAPRQQGGAARTVWCPRRGGGRSAWGGPVTLGGKWGLGLCPRTFPKVRSRPPVGA